MSGEPDDLLFTRDHVWVRVAGGVARVGLTDFAQQNLGDVVDVTLPDADDRVTAGQPCGDVESTKSVNDLVAPVSGVVAEINADVAERPEVVNVDPYGDGWLMVVRLDQHSGTADLLSRAEYAQLTGT